MRIVKKNYIGAVTFTDGRAIRAEYILDGGKNPNSRGRERAREFVRRELRKHLGWNAALRELYGVTNEDTVTLNEAKKHDDPVNTRIHEDVHVRANERFPKVSFLGSIVMEESIAYALADYECFQRGLEKADRRIVLLSARGLHSMRFIQHIEHGVDSTSWNATLKVLYTNADRENRNLAHAFCCAADYMFYRECLAVLEKFGLKQGEEILFQVLEAAIKDGLEFAWMFMLKNLGSRTANALIDDAKLPGKPVVIVNPYSPRCKIEEYELY